MISTNLRIRYADEKGKITWEEFDLIVLSVGLNSPSGAVDLAEKSGVEVNVRQTCSLDPIAKIPELKVCAAAIQATKQSK